MCICVKQFVCVCVFGWHGKSVKLYGGAIELYTYILSLGILAPSIYPNWYVYMCRTNPVLFQCMLCASCRFHWLHATALFFFHFTLQLQHNIDIYTLESMYIFRILYSVLWYFVCMYLYGLLFLFRNVKSKTFSNHHES